MIIPPILTTSLYIDFFKVLENILVEPGSGRVEAFFTRYLHDAITRGLVIIPLAKCPRTPLGEEFTAGSLLRKIIVIGWEHKA